MTTESKQERFVRLANARVNRCLKDISLVSNLASSQYAREDAQVEAIIAALSGAVLDLQSKFVGTTNAPKFSL